MEVEHAVVIDRPLEVVWEAFDDPDLLLQWQHRIIRYQQISGRHDEIGSVSRQTILRSGEEVELTVTLIDRRPPEFSKSQYEGLPFPFTIANTFTSVDGDATEWHAVIDVRLNLVQMALAPVLKGALEKLAEQNGEDFKRFVESR